MNFRQLEAYRAIMIEGSVTRAAMVLHISQPAASRLLLNLEDETGFPLFTRTKGKLVPTKEGELFYRVVEKAFIRLDDIAEKAKQIRERKFGNIKIAGMPAVSLDFLSAVISGFMKDKPDVHITLDIFTSQGVMDLLSMQQYDIGFACDPVEDPSYEIETISVPYVCILPEDHPLSKKSGIHVKDMDGEKMILPAKGISSRYLFDEQFRKFSVKPCVNLEVSVMMAEFSMVRQKLGISFVEPFSVINAAGTGVKVLPLEPAVMFDFGIIVPANRPRSRLTDSFISAFKQKIETCFCR